MTSYSARNYIDNISFLCFNHVPMTHLRFAFDMLLAVCSRMRTEMRCDLKIMRLLFIPLSSSDFFERASEHVSNNFSLIILRMLTFRLLLLLVSSTFRLCFLSKIAHFSFIFHSTRTYITNRFVLK